MKEKKKLIIGILSVLIVVMAVGYALLAQELTINGRASIDSTWKVEITNITQKELVGGTVEKNKSYNATTANFDVEFSQPGDSITYDIEVTNKGTLDAVVESISVITTNDQEIKYVTSGIKKGDKLLKNGGKHYLTIKIECDPNLTSHSVDTINNITVTINYQQDLGQVAVYDAYSVGDTVQFAGSNWKVIKNSTLEEDYVTLMKETVLTSSELGNYAITHICTANDVGRHRYGCTTVGEEQPFDTMAYYWDDNCHPDAYGYSSSSGISNCGNTNSYATSKVKEMLEGTYINTLGEGNLKEVDGYKIRLITTNELNENLGWVNLQATATTDNENANVPTWVYRNFGERQKNVDGYWTMTPLSDTYRVQFVNCIGKIDSSNVYYSGIGVRPVINLLKAPKE